MVDMYLMCLFWIFCELFTEDTEGSNSQPQNDDSMTAETFLTVEDLFGEAHILTQAQLTANGEALGLTAMTVFLMLQKAIDTGLIEFVSIT